MAYDVFKYGIVDDEIEEAIIYYKNISLQLGLRFENEIFKSFDALATNPDYYFNLNNKKQRSISIKGSPHAFIYCIEGNVVTIKMLFSQLDNPAKLFGRIGKL